MKDMIEDKNNTARIVINSGLVLPVFSKRSKLIEEMKRRGFEVCISGYQVEGKDECLRRGCAFFHVPMSRSGLNPVSDLQTLYNYYRQYKIGCFDVVHSYTAKPNIYGSIAARMAGVNRIFPTINGLGYAFTNNSLKGRMVRGATCILYKIAFACSTRVIFQNHDDMEELIGRRVVRRDKCVVVAGSGVDVNEYAYSTPTEGNTFLLASRLLVTKGVRNYIEAARLVKRIHPNAIFRLAGGLDSNPDSITQKELDASVEDGTIEYLGKVDDMRSTLSECNVFVLPSYYREGVPHAVLEAMSVGRAIITTDVPGCRETVNGANGVLLPPQNSAELAKAMIWMIDHPEEVKRMGIESRRYAEERFNVDLVNRDILTIMDIDTSKYGV